MRESPTSDYSGIVVVGLNHYKQIFVLDAYEARIDPLAQREKILQLSEFWKPKLVTIEKNAYQKALYYAVEEVARERGQYVPLRDFLAGSGKSKEARIRSALQQPFATRRVWVRKNLINFVEQYMKFGKSDHEHLLDAMAQGPTGDKLGPFWRYPQSVEARKFHLKRSEEMQIDLGVTGYGI